MNEANHSQYGFFVSHMTKDLCYTGIHLPSTPWLGEVLVKLSYKFAMTLSQLCNPLHLWQLEYIVIELLQKHNSLSGNLMDGLAALDRKSVV